MLRLSLYCRIGDHNLGSVAAEQPPRVGDLLLYRPPEWSGFSSQETWRVDAIAWTVATPGSVWTADRLRASQPVGLDGTVTETVDVHLWPDRGPFWPEIPEWAKRIVPEEEEPDDD